MIHGEYAIKIDKMDDVVFAFKVCVVWLLTEHFNPRNFFGPVVPECSGRLESWESSKHFSPPAPR